MKKCEKIIFSKVIDKASRHFIYKKLVKLNQKEKKND